MSDASDQLRDKVWTVTATVESRGLFVHSGELVFRFTKDSKSGVKKTSLPLIAGSCILNALVPRSAMLLVGGHGGGKTTLAKLLGRMMTGRSLQEIEDGVLHGHPQLTEEKMVATLKPGPLMKDGREVVVWRKFVTGFWKILDEINRLTPHAQNILLSMLAEGELKYYDEVKRCEEYCFYATMNPADSGTFELSPPFLDRFGIAVPITMPSINDLELILATRDEKLFGYDELWQVPALLTEEDLLTIWNLADKMPVSKEASEFMRALVREFGACIRVDKSQARNPNVETGLCDGCHFNTSKSVCSNVSIPLSVRAAKDLNRYSKAVAWLFGAREVNVETVKTIAPLVFWHRTEFSHEAISKSPFYGNKFEFTKYLVELASARFAGRSPAVEILEKFKHGEANKEDMEKLRAMSKSDLLIQLDYVDFAKELNRSKYVSMIKRIENGIRKKDVNDLSRVYDELIRDADFPNRATLLGKVSAELHRLTLAQFTLDFEKWQDLWTTISLKHPRMTPILKETLTPPRRKVIRTEQMTLVVYVTGDQPDSKVFLEVSGGRNAMDLRSDIEQALKQEG